MLAYRSLVLEVQSKSQSSVLNVSLSGFSFEIKKKLDSDLSWKKNIHIFDKAGVLET